MPRQFATRILFGAQKCPDEEVCGLVGKNSDGELTLYPVKNVADQPQSQFEMDPQQQIDSLRRMRDANEQLLAIYHSHPTTPPEPSARDLDALGYPEAIYLIISLNIKGVLEMRGWRRTAPDNSKNLEEIELKVMA